jgi:thiosulfate/3-mercaptopyruvate sulfurtransferase
MTTSSQTAPAGGSEYARPEVLVSTGWVEEHLQDPRVRILDCNEDPYLYAAGHIPGAVRIDWHEHLNDPVRRDYVDRAGLQRLLRSAGIHRDSVVVLYGDNNNWWAAFAFWVLSLFGLSRLRLTALRIMDGGRDLWQMEHRPMTDRVPSPSGGDVVIGERNDRGIRAFRGDVLEHVRRGGRLVDVRSPAEFDGVRLHMPGYPNEGALRGGHIPGALNIPWSRAIDPATHRFLSPDQLRVIYRLEHGLAPDEDLIVYCRIGERSAHTTFVLTQLLGYSHVRNYDGSWCEWGNAVRVPIAR